VYIKNFIRFKYSSIVVRFGISNFLWFCVFYLERCNILFCIMFLLRIFFANWRPRYSSRWCWSDVGLRSVVVLWCCVRYSKCSSFRNKHNGLVSIKIFSLISLHICPFFFKIHAILIFADLGLFSDTSRFWDQ